MAEVTNVSANQQSALAAATASAVSTLPSPQQLGQNDFLNLLVTQLKNQDPLKPIENQEFVAQLAQFSQLQQSTQQVTLLQQLINAQTASQQYSLLPLIGHHVDVNGSLLELGTGNASLSFSLPADAKSVSITIVDAADNSIRALNLGSRNAGLQEIQWDGLDQNGLRVNSGVYRYLVSAVDKSGQAVQAATRSSVTVSGIQPHDGQPPSLLAGDQVIDPSTVLAIR